MSAPAPFDNSAHSRARKPAGQIRVTRHLRGGVLVLTLLGVMSSGGAPVFTQANNPVVLENQQAGSNGWLATVLANDTAQQIKGYASTTSLSPGETINFYVTV